MDYQAFFDSILGKVAVGALLCGLLVISSLMTGNKKQGATALACSAVSIALAFVLNNIIIFRMPQGGSVTPFSMFAVSVIGYWFGTRQGVMTGMAFGLLNMIVSPYVISPLQGLLDYPIAYGMLGLSGAAFHGRTYRDLIAGFTLGVLGRLFCSFLSGVLFFAEWAPEAYGAVLWSLVYNGSFMGAEYLLTALALAVRPFREAVFTIGDRIKNTERA
ncbi:MAG: energy-coupled thiamine transporter ThiT [Eubacteriaceae bacterium]|nr:energy-coupled thiamine transporter ThiT [Eubacteriaceae bacterium]